MDDHTGGTDAGSVYVFVRSGTIWNAEEKLISSDSFPADFFGLSAAIQGDTAVVGCPRDDLGGDVDEGSAYVFRLGPSAPSPTYCTAGTSASGCQAAISASGTPSASAVSGFYLMAANVEGAKDGAFFFGTNGKQAHPWGNGTSFQCVVPPVARTGLQNGTGTAGLCNGSFARDLNALWCPTCPFSGKNPGSGVAVQAQLWYRDPQSTSNQATSLSDAIEFCVTP